MSLQEKFQITIPAKVEDGHTWVDQKSVRKTGEAGFAHTNNSSALAECNAKFNFLPPGMDAADTSRVRVNNMPLSVAGSTDISQTTTAEGFAKGFVRKAMDPCSDLYSGEHIDLFYGEAKDEEGHVGFVERNNYLDRA